MGMSWLMIWLGLGARDLLRKSILAEDKWYCTADEMVEYLKEKFAADKTKEYHHIDEKITAEQRIAGREEREIKGCKAAHVITFSPDGVSVNLWKTIRD